MGTSQTRLRHSHDTLVCSRHGKALKKKKRKKRTGFLTNVSLFLLVLWSDLCVVPSRSRSTTIEPPSASSDPKSPSLSLRHFPLFRFWVFSLFWHFLSMCFFFGRFGLTYPYACYLLILYVWYFFWFYFYEPYACLGFNIITILVLSVLWV